MTLSLSAEDREALVQGILKAFICSPSLSATNNFLSCIYKEKVGDVYISNCSRLFFFNP